MEVIVVEVPSGVVTLVFSDIQGSTVLWEHLGADFKALLDQHNSLFRAAIDEFGGYEVKTEGDAFMVAFTKPEAAVSMGLAMQERLHQAVWPDSLDDPPLFALAGRSEDGLFCGLRVRIGVHTGNPDCHPDPLTGRMDYFGRMVNRAARVGGVGHGGQLVVSQACWDAIGGSFDGASIEDLGEHALRGLEGHERLRQLLPKSLAGRRFPRLRTPSLKKTNLPAHLDSFFGREPELQELETRLQSGQRLITVLGAGGTGKTRLAQRFGAQQLANFPGGVWFCDLVEARSRSGILLAMGRALDLSLTERDPEVQLENLIISRGKILVLLDNFEQVVDHGAATLGRWLAAAPAAVFIVTSRSLLRIAGEQVFYLDPLPSAEAMHLFYDRGRAVQPNFTRSADNEPIVSEIVERLDCISLAIELAAARVRMMPPEQIRSRLSERFKLLKGRRRDQSARQATLRGAIDWSWELLQPLKRSALAQLSVFRGGCTLEAAEAVVDLDAFADDPCVMDVVEALVDHSLLRRVEPLAGYGRYRMLESVRQYAAERLADGAAATAVRHGAYFASFGALDVVRALETHGGVARGKALALDLENLVAGVAGNLGAGDRESAALCALAASLIFLLKGPISDGITLLNEVSAEGLEKGIRARLLHRTCDLLQFAGRQAEALTHGEKALAIYAELGDQSGQASGLQSLGKLHAQKGQYVAATDYYERAIALYRGAGDRQGEGLALGNLGILHHHQGRTSEALTHYEAGLSVCEEVGNYRRQGGLLGNLGTLHQQQGRMTEAMAHHQRALAIYREVGDQAGEGIAHGNVGDLLFVLDDRAGAEKHLRQAIEFGDDVYSGSAAAFRGSLALILADRGELLEARELLLKAGSRLRGVYAFEFAKLLCKSARVEQLGGDPIAAAAALAEAEGIAAALEVSADSELRLMLGEARAAVAP
jgi:predicted ATPase/class 3 adenylate cyclase/Tfp pilus assembly protein PilF